MNKLLVGLVSLLVAAAPALAADGGCSGKKCGCKPKKYRIIYVTAHNPDTMYGDYVFDDPDVGPEYVEADYDYDQSYADNDEDVYSSSDDSRSSRRTRSSSYDPDWYVGGRLGLSLMTWKNKYSALPTSAIVDLGADHDNYWFQPIFTGNIFAGLRFAPSWRADIEGGYITQFTDSDNGISFKLSVPYVTANVYWNFIGNFYLGAGMGVAFPKINIDWEHFVSNNSSKTRTSFTGGLMFGYTNYLSESVAFDFRYRIAGFMGPELTRGAVSGNPYGLNSLETKTGFILDNSFTIGLRYEF